MCLQGKAAQTISSARPVAAPDVHARDGRWRFRLDHAACNRSSACQLGPGCEQLGHGDRRHSPPRSKPHATANLLASQPTVAWSGERGHVRRARGTGEVGQSLQLYWHKDYTPACEAAGIAVNRLSPVLRAAMSCGSLRGWSDPAIPPGVRAPRWGRMVHGGFAVASRN